MSDDPGETEDERRRVGDLEAFLARLARRKIGPRSDGTFRQRFGEHVPEILVSLADQLDMIVDSDDPAVRRLFPTAYADDPEKDAGYQILARDELVQARRDAIRTVRASAGKEILTEDELTAWMAVTNDLRLVLGTRLDVSEDDDVELDEMSDTEEAELRRIYEFLGYVLSEIVDGLSRVLPDEGTQSEG